MAYGRKTGGRDFSKGNTFGRGSKKLTDEQKELAKMLKAQDGKLLIAKYAFEEDGEGSPTLDRLIKRVLEVGLNKGDVNVLEWVFNRLGWKVVSENDSVININYSVVSKDTCKQIEQLND